MSYVLLLHYLELCEAIEEQNVDAVDNSMFIGKYQLINQSINSGTDIPTEIPLPDKIYLDEADHEQIKSIVLAELVDRQIDRRLKIDPNTGVYEASLIGEGSDLNNQSIH